MNIFVAIKTNYKYGDYKAFVFKGEKELRNFLKKEYDSYQEYDNDKLNNEDYNEWVITNELNISLDRILKIFPNYIDLNSIDLIESIRLIEKIGNKRVENNQ